MTLDNILIRLGEFGKYQKFVVALTCFSSVFVGLYAVMSVIFLHTPKHRCKIPGLANDTYDIQSTYQQNLVNNYIPPATDDVTLDYDQCHLYSFGYNNVKFDNSSRPINASLVKCNKWVYSDSEFTETFTSKYDIVCEDAHITSLIKSLFFVGKFVGALVFGTLSDTFGRKKTFYLTLVMHFGIAFGSSWSSSSSVYAVFSVLTGATTQGVFIVGFVLGLDVYLDVTKIYMAGVVDEAEDAYSSGTPGIEFVGPSKRKSVGMIILTFFIIGLVILPAVSYLARHWYYINIICSAPAVLFMCYWWLLPESPRWLITKKRYEEANTILQKVAKVNKVTIKRNLFEELKNEEVQPTGRVWQLFSSKVMLVRTLIILFNWCVVSMTYYGLYLNAGNLGGNFHLNMFLSGVVEFPANLMIWLLVDRVGRKPVYFCSMILGGCACASTIIPLLYGEVENQAVIVTLAMIGKFGLSAAFNTIYIFSAELFPTVVRNAGMGTSCCASRIGGILAPYIADSAAFIGGSFGKAFPLGVFGVISIAAGLSSLYLPETLNMALPETIKDGIMFGKQSIPASACADTLLERTEKPNNLQEKA